MGTMTLSPTVNRRYDMLFLFDVKDGNPNGDPDAGNQPRLDPETNHGIVTDVCLKRKIRNAVVARKQNAPGGDGPGYEIYVKHQGILANEQRRAFKAVKAEPSAGPNIAARSWMCRNFFDVRAFGAVMTTGKTGDDDNARREGRKLWNCGQVRGPIQFTFARSFDPIIPLDVGITRVALTNVGDTDRAVSIDEETGEEKAGSGQMGRKYAVPYALYRGYGFVNPALAKETGFTHPDLDLLFEALLNMFEADRSSSRGLMAVRKVYVFQHETALGQAPAHVLFERAEQVIRRNPGKQVARAFEDYDVPSLATLKNGLPRGVLLRELVEEGLAPTPWNS